MKNCPKCQKGYVSIDLVLEAEPTFEGSTEFYAKQKARATCTECDLNGIGRLENATMSADGKTFTGGHFVGERNG